MKRMSSVVLGVAVCALAVCAQGSTFTWTAGGGGTTTWVTPANWGGTAPTAGDDALFTGATNRTVTLDANKTVVNITVSGTANWTFGPTYYYDGGYNHTSTYYTLNDTTFTYGSTGTSNYYAALTGNVTVDGGVLKLWNSSDTPTSFTVNAGTLYGIYSDYQGIFGSAFIPITLGDTSGAADATLAFEDAWGGTTYANPITVRAGSTGRAIITDVNTTLTLGYRNNNSSGYSGAITLQKDVTFLENNIFGPSQMAGNNRLNINGAIGGTGNVYTDGVGFISLGGANTYTGTTNVVGISMVYLSNAANTNTGNIYVPAGQLFVASDGALGNSANTVTLGAPGSFGSLGMEGWSINIARNITLSGNGGFLTSRNGASGTYSGIISGTSTTMLILTPGGGTQLTNNNTYGGGTIIVNGGVAADSVGGNPWNNYSGNANNNFLGSGDVHIGYCGSLRLTGANNLGVGAKVYVNDIGYGGGLVIGAELNYGSFIDPSSSGTLLWDNNKNQTGATITALADGTHPIGNGYMYLGVAGMYDALPGTITSLAALVANQSPGPDGHYTYFMGNCGNDYQIGWYNSGPFNDIGAQVFNLQIGKPGVWAEGMGVTTSIDSNNTFSGSVNVANRNTVRIPTNTSFGSTTAPVNLILNGQGVGEGLYYTFEVFNTGSSTSTVTKGNLSYNGAVIIGLDRSTDVTKAAELDVASLTQGTNSTLGFYPAQNSLNSTEKFKVAGGLTGSYNMLPAYYWNAKSLEFVDYDTNGIKPVTSASPNVVTTLAGAGATNIVYSSGDAVTSGGQTVYALRTTGAITGASGDALTVGSGGFISAPPTSAGLIHTAPINFGANPGIIYADNPGWSDVWDHSTWYVSQFSGTITGSAGLIKSGKSILKLTADNSATLSGDITVDEGALMYNADNQTGAGAIVVNGGIVYFGFASDNGHIITTNKTIKIGSNGGTVGAWFYGDCPRVIFAGNIVDLDPAYPGPLYSSVGWQETFSGTGNTYSGGTMVGGMSSITVTANSSLGTGDVIVGQGNGGFSNPSAVILLGNNNVSTTSMIYLMVHGSELGLGGTAPQLGGVEGNGWITLGWGGDDHAGTTIVTTGLNNKDADLYGAIVDYNPAKANGLTKAGTATLTLWGPNEYTGPTTVNNGKLVNNNWINGPVNVTHVTYDLGATYTAPVYDGMGTTKGLVTVNAGGTATGSGVFNAGLTLVGGTATGNLTINGPVNVDAAGTFSSNGPITGAVATAGTFAGNASITGTVSVTGGTFGGNHVINGTFVSNAAVSGASIFNGAVTVAGGTFTGTHAINANYTQSGGALSGTSTFGSAASPVAVTVNAGSFGGNNTINGTFTTAADSNVVLTTHNGDIAGTLAVVGTATLDHSTALNFNLGPAGTTGGNVNDFINITGDLSLDGTLNVNNLAGFATGTYTLIDYTGALTGAGLTLGTTPTGFNYSLNTATANEIELIVAPLCFQGDTNGDTAVNSLDIDAIYRHLTVLPPGFTGWNGVGGDQPWPWAQSAYQAQYDVNNDQAVSQDDVTYELRNYFLTSYGDADLSRATDFQDFQALLDHWQNSGAGIGWAQADFNGDGVVDFLDFQNLLDYWNPSGWNFAPTQTPEPASLTLILLGGLALIRRRKP